MCRSRERLRASWLALVAAVSLCAWSAPSHAQPAPASRSARDDTPRGDPARFAGIGREATAAEVKAWDIDVRPDFKGLPPGSGSVAKGQDVWEAKCASCHGVFGESNQVFNPIVGGTTADDIKTGHVARLKDPAYPARTTLMKVATVSTLWDYINRAMPWTQPKSLTTEEVYAVTAFILNLGGIVPDDYTLSDKNIADVQARMPNRNGMTSDHALWPGSEFSARYAKPDVKAALCMRDCVDEPKVSSRLPDFARNAHGDLAQQNRLVGAQHGVETATNVAPAVPRTLRGDVGTPAVRVAQADLPKAETKKPEDKKPDEKPTPKPASALPLAQKNNCTACHAVNTRIVGPSFAEIAKKHAGKADYLQGKILSGGSGVWGPIPMPPQTLSPADAKSIATWLASGAPQ